MEGIPSATIEQMRTNQVAIGFPREVLPEVKSYQSLPHCLSFSYQNGYQVSTWRIVRPFNELADLQYSQKSLKCSSVTSRLYETDGQRARVDFIKALSARYPGAIDVFGYGWKTEELEGSYLGPLGERFASASNPLICKWAGLAPYRYSLACENNLIAGYFTEKLIDCFLTWTMPIYYGCPDVYDFFPKESVIPLDLSSSTAIDDLYRIIQEPLSNSQLKALAEARNLTLYQYNLWPSIERVLQHGYLRAGRKLN
jgi:hypothetical protein